MTKAITDFSGYAAAALAPIAQACHDGLAAHAATFPALPLTMPALQTLITDFAAALAAKSSGASAATIAFNVSRHELESALGDLGAAVNIVAKGDPAIVTLSGFPAYETTGHGPDTSAPVAPPTSSCARVT